MHGNNPVIIEYENWILKRVSGKDSADYSLRCGAMYVEFSAVHPHAEAILLGGNASVRRGGVPDRVERALESLR